MERKNLKGIINIDNLKIQNAYIQGGNFPLENNWTYTGTWYEANATDTDDNEYKIYWTAVNWDNDGDESDACDWDNPDYIFQI